MNNTTTVTKVDQAPAVPQAALVPAVDIVEIQPVLGGGQPLQKVGPGIR